MKIKGCDRRQKLFKKAAGEAVVPLWELQVLEPIEEENMQSEDQGSRRHCS